MNAGLVNYQPRKPLLVIGAIVPIVVPAVMPVVLGLLPLVLGVAPLVFVVMFVVVLPLLHAVGVLATVLDPSPMMPAVVSVFIAIVLVAVVIAIAIPLVPAATVVIESAYRVDHHIGDRGARDDFNQIVVLMIGAGGNWKQ